jgi:hypothetical protein
MKKPKAGRDRRKATVSDSLAKGVTESIPAKHELRNRPSDSLPAGKFEDEIRKLESEMFTVAKSSLTYKRDCDWYAIETMMNEAIKRASNVFYSLGKRDMTKAIEDKVMCDPSCYAGDYDKILFIWKQDWEAIKRELPQPRKGAD